MERILTLNIGATRLALAEFSVRSGRAPSLVRYTYGELPGSTPDDPNAFSVEIEQVLRGMLASSGIRAGRLYIALSGQMAFPRFVKVLAESAEKMEEQIRFEVEQNVPFPLNEAIVSRAMIGNPVAGEQPVMIVAAREAIVSAVTRAALNVGCEPEVVDVAPIALYNAVRFNYPDAVQEGCVLVVDIGARCTNLVFVEQERIFYRSIPVAGNTITAEIAKEFEISLEDAEALKCESGLVAQGGVFEMEDPEMDRLSKTIRNVMTRLNAEIMRSITFYRTQQEGMAPTTVLITGATSQLPYMQNFFDEKLPNASVDFLNPFQTVGYPAKIDLDQFGRDAFTLPVLVGLALRRGLTCPVEVNLVSRDIAERRIFRNRLPFLGLATVCVVATLVTWIFFVKNLKDSYESQSRTIDARVSEYQSDKAAYDRVDKKALAAEKRADAYRTLLQRHGEWMEVMVAINRAIPKGLWITSLSAKQKEGVLQGVDLSISMWKDLEANVAQAGKTVPEVIAANLAAAPIFDDESKANAISKINQSVDWMMSFEITAKRKTAESAETSAKTRRNGGKTK